MNELIRDIADKGTLLTFDELRILLFSHGAKKLEGILMPEKILTEQEIIYAVHHMTGKGIIMEKTDAFVIREDILQMLEIMITPRQTSICGVQQEYFCYENEQMAVVSERYWKKADTIKLRLFKQKDFQEWKGMMADDNS